MPTNNFKLFDENKTNILTDDEYAANTQRQNGVQTGVASSKLNNKFSYQTSLVAYAIAQIMNANGKDASDADAVATFVANLQGSLVQKVLDCASSAEAIAGVLNNKYITPATMKAAALMLAGGTMTGPLYLSRDPVDPLEAATKQWVEEKAEPKVGDILYTTREIDDPNYVKCDGTFLLPEKYPELKTLWDNTDEFRVANMTDKFQYSFSTGYSNGLLYCGKFDGKHIAFVNNSNLYTSNNYDTKITFMYSEDCVTWNLFPQLPLPNTIFNSTFTTSGTQYALSPPVIRNGRLYANLIGFSSGSVPGSCIFYMDSIASGWQHYTSAISTSTISQNGLYASIPVFDDSYVYAGFFSVYSNRVHYFFHKVNLQTGEITKTASVSGPATTDFFRVNSNCNFCYVGLTSSYIYFAYESGYVYRLSKSTLVQSYVSRSTPYSGLNVTIPVYKDNEFSGIFIWMASSSGITPYLSKLNDAETGYVNTRIETTNSGIYNQALNYRRGIGFYLVNNKIYTTTYYYGSSYNTLSFYALLFVIEIDTAKYKFVNSLDNIFGGIDAKTFLYPGDGQIYNFNGNFVMTNLNISTKSGTPILDGSYYNFCIPKDLIPLPTVSNPSERKYVRVK